MRTRVEVRAPSRHFEAAFLFAARRSRAFYRRWGNPPSTSQAFGAYLKRCRRQTHEGHFLVERSSGCLLGVVNLMEIVRGSLQGAYLGYYLFVPYEGHGFMAEGLRLVLPMTGLRSGAAHAPPGARIRSGLRRRARGARGGRGARAASPVAAPR
jgi:ribosomal-protein-alanine N-acetyltransferase